ncbi:MAG: DNA-binding protein [Clostridia bacterium]
MRLKYYAMAALLLLFPVTAQAADASVSSTQLIENAKALDESMVSYTGEVVGDILLRGESAWVSITDGNNTISVYAPTEATNAITHMGKYGQKGDVVAVDGIFHRACAQHGGDMDIHADGLNIIQKGYAEQHEYSQLYLVFTCVLVIGAAAMVVLVIRKYR